MKQNQNKNSTDNKNMLLKYSSNFLNGQNYILGKREKKREKKRVIFDLFSLIIIRKITIYFFITYIFLFLIGGGLYQLFIFIIYGYINSVLSVFLVYGIIFLMLLIIPLFLLIKIVFYLSGYYKKYFIIKFNYISYFKYVTQNEFVYKNHVYYNGDYEIKKINK